jgi:hypothetical protein
LHIFSIQCSYILKKIQYQIKFEIKTELAALKKSQKIRLEDLKKSFIEFEYNLDPASARAFLLLNNSLECILKECESTSFVDKEEIIACIKNIQSTYENQNMNACNKLLKNNSEFLCSILQSLMLLIK